MRRIYSLLTTFVMLTAMFAIACEQEAADGFVDASGTEVSLPERPTRVAVLFSSFADIWVCAGGEVDITVGESVERGFADESAILVDSGAGHSAIDLELLIASEPELVIGTYDYVCQREAVELCRGLGIPAIALRVESFGDYLAVLKLFTELTGESERYVRYGTEVAEAIEAVLADSRSDGGSYLLVRAGTSANSTKAKTSSESFVCRMLDELGLVNIAGRESVGELSLEAMLERNPDLLFITTMGNEAAAEDFMRAQLTEPGWRELECVRSGNFFFLSRELFHFKPNSRWDEAYACLALIIKQNEKANALY